MENQQIKLGLEIVAQEARALRRRLPRRVDLEDLISDGQVGLLRAMARFDPSRQVPFAPYARRRIRGEMIDGIRQRDWIPRSVRRAGLPAPRFYPIDDAVAAPAPINRVDCRDALRAALSGLRRRRRLVLQLYYLEDLSLKQIADSLGVTEAAVSLLIKSICKAGVRPAGRGVRRKAKEPLVRGNKCS